MAARFIDLLNLQDAESRKTLFVLGQAVVAFLLVGGFLFLRKSSPASGFKVRESDRLKKGKGASNSGPDLLAHAKMKTKNSPERPLQLEGIRIQGVSPHEILGVSPQASAAEVQRAYRDLMKRYHPDRVGRPGSREWTDAQRIAEAINRAKDQLLGKKS